MGVGTAGFNTGNCGLGYFWGWIYCKIGEGKVGRLTCLLGLGNISVRRRGGPGSPGQKLLFVFREVSYPFLALPFHCL